MNRLSDVIYAVCICAVLNSAVRLLSPEKFAKEIRVICTLLLVLCTAAKISPGFKVDAGGVFDSYEKTDYANIVLEDTEKALEDRLVQKLKEAGIQGAAVGIDCTLDEYNYVAAARVRITLAKDEAEARGIALETAKELFPEAETEVDIYDEEAEKDAFR